MTGRTKAGHDRKIEKPCALFVRWLLNEIEVIPQSGLSVSAAVQRVRQLPKQQMPERWDRISKIKDRDFSQMRIAIEIENSTLKHVDGVHRLLAYRLFDKHQDLCAYVAGL